MEVVEQTALDKSTASRLLGFLQKRQLITRDALTKRYSVGPALLSLAAVTLQSSDLRRVARQYLGRIRDLTGETVSLHLRIGPERVCIDGVESNHVIRRVVPLGQPIPLYVGPSGKAILAYLPEREIGQMLKSARITSDERTHLSRQLMTIRERGAMVAIGDRTPGVGAISVPLFDPSGPVGAITVAGPADRWNLDRLNQNEVAISAMAAEISSALGGRRP